MNIQLHKKNVSNVCVFQKKAVTLQAVIHLTISTYYGLSFFWS